MAATTHSLRTERYRLSRPRPKASSDGIAEGHDREPLTQVHFKVLEEPSFAIEVETCSVHENDPSVLAYTSAKSPGGQCRGAMMHDGLVGRIFEELHDAGEIRIADQQDIVPPLVVRRNDVRERMAEIDVIDNGKGFPAMNRQRLLEPYMTTRSDGTGLGLPIVAKIVEDHGGRLELLDSPLGRGACVRLILPLVGAKDATPPGNEAARSREPELTGQSGA